MKPYQYKLARLIFLFFIIMTTGHLTIAQCTGYNFAFAGHGEERDEGHGVAFLPNGNVVHGGWFDSLTLEYNDEVLDNTADMNGNGDVYAYCMDPSGDVVWSYTAGGESNSDWCWDLDAGPTGNVFLVGQFYSNDFDIGTEVFDNDLSSNGFLICLDQDGEVQWAKNLSATSSCNIDAVSALENGGCVVAGSFNSSMTIGDTTLESISSTAGFVGRLDALGNWEWVVSVDSDGSDAIREVTADSDNNVYLGLYASGDINIAGTDYFNTGIQDAFLVKLDADGNQEWAHQIAGESNEEIQGLDCDGEGNVYVGGMWFDDDVSFAGEDLINNGAWDLFVAKLDADGDLIWINSGGGTEVDQIHHLVVDNTGLVHVGGHMGNAPMTIDGITVDQHGALIMVFDQVGTMISGVGIGSDVAAFASWDKVQGIDASYDGRIAINGFFNSTQLTFGDITIEKIGGIGDFESFVAVSGNTGFIDITAEFSGPDSLCSGEMAEFSVMAESQEDVIYYFYENDINILFNESGILEFPVETEDDVLVNEYYVIIENPCFSVETDPLELTVLPLPVTEVEDLEFCEGESVAANFDSTAEFILVTDEFGEELSGNFTEAGTYFVLSDLEGCTTLDTMTVVVNELPDVSITMNETLFCVEDEAPTVVSISPPGGILSGEGIAGLEFYPSEAGVGEWLLQYTYTDENGCPNRAFQVVEVEVCGSVEINSFSDLKIYPNPFKGSIEVLLNAEVDVYIYNSMGELVFAQMNQKGLRTFDLSSLSAGMYSMILTNDSGSIGHKIIRE